METILICASNREGVENFEMHLLHEHYRVLKAEDSQGAIDLLHSEDVTLLILGADTPGMDAARTIMAVREDNNLPIIVVSSKSDEADKVLALNVGADDYMVKPVSFLELVARVNAQLRRYITLGSISPSAQGIFRTGGLVIFDDRKEVTVDGREVRLTPLEYSILLFLVRNAGKVYSVNQIYEHIWNEDAVGTDNTVSVHVRHIREKIEKNPRNPVYIKSVWGVGYKVEKID